MEVPFGSLCLPPLSRARRRPERRRRSGKTDAPTVSLDTGPAQRKLESKLGDEKKKLEEELKKKGGDLLKDLFKKKK